MLERLRIVPAFDTPAPPAPPELLPWALATPPPLPPLIAPALVSVAIVPEFATPAPPVPPTDPEPPAPPLIVAPFALVKRSMVRPELAFTPMPPAPPETPPETPAAPPIPPLFVSVPIPQFLA